MKFATICSCGISMPTSMPIGIIGRQASRCFEAGHSVRVSNDLAEFSRTAIAIAAWKELSPAGRLNARLNFRYG